jgi:hypothetical protein
MNHFVNGFGEVLVRLRIDMPVATRPVRAAQACIGQAHPGAQHHDRPGKRSASERKTAKPKQTLLRIHG